MSDEEADEHPRDTSRPILLIGFLERGNLGLGYIASVLRQHGYRVLVVEFETEPEDILRAAQAADPLVVGFSMIFQFHVKRFHALAQYLRRNGITCHFTAGGHFPSLSYQHTLELIPELDSVVRFEGEFTLLELADCLGLGSDWHGIRGLAFRQDGSVAVNPARPLIADLDQLPYPERDPKPMRILGRRAMPMLASRGCSRTCSFCSIHMFYRSAPGRVVRTRTPAEVAEEMRKLQDEHDVQIFLFQDDDFPLFGPVWRRWADEFVRQLHRRRLPARAIWKISCRVDSVEPELFATLRDAGMYLAFLGLESGTEDGLKVLNKGITVEQSLRAVAILKRLGLAFEYGFMLFEPSSTFDSIRANVEFLRAIVGDGSAAALFCRMLPFDGTPIKEALKATGRLRGDVCDPDYDFLDPRLGGLFADVDRLVHRADWIFGPHALAYQLNYAWGEVAVMQRLFPPLAGFERYKGDLRGITKASNEKLLRVVEELAEIHEDGAHSDFHPSGTGRPAQQDPGNAHARLPGKDAPACPPSVEEDFVSSGRAFLNRLLETRNGFVLRNQELLLRSLGVEGTPIAQS